MNSDSLKKPLPFPFVLFWGFGLIFFNVFEKIHPFHPAVYTPLYLFLVDILPSTVVLAIILYGFTNPSYRKPAQTLLLVFSLWDMTGSILNTCDLWNLTKPQIVAVFQSWSPSHTFLKGNVQNFGNWVLDFLIGWSFLKKKPLGYEYPLVNPFQDVFMKFTGVLWVLDSVYQIGFHSIILLYKLMKMV
jgi:hypothetical protein